MESLLKSFPLPSAPSHQCRDAFLAELLEPYHIEVEEKESTPEKLAARQIRFHSTAFNTLERLLDHYISQQEPLRHSEVKKNPRATKFTAPDVNQMLKDRYGDLASSISFIAVVFELTNVANWINIARQMWRMKSNVDRSLNMFSWSIQDYFTRFGLRNMAYLDGIERELKGQMDCFKFCKDMKEVIRLVNAICEDFKQRRDICKNSMLLIRDAEIDINELLTNSQNEATMQKEQLAKAIQNTPRSADPDRCRQKALQKKINYLDLTAPIEARYRINWAQAALDQSLMSDDIKTEELCDELDYWANRLVEVRELWELSLLAYNMEINKYKDTINQVELSYESDMEKCDGDIQVTQNKLNKAKEDLIFFRNQVPMFHARIEEVQQVLLAREEANRAPRASKERKSSRLSKRKSVPLQKKK